LSRQKDTFTGRLETQTSQGKSIYVDILENCSRVSFTCATAILNTETSADIICWTKSYTIGHDRSCKTTAELLRGQVPAPACADLLVDTQRQIKLTVEAEEKHHLETSVLASGTLVPHLWPVNWQAPELQLSRLEEQQCQVYQKQQCRLSFESLASRVVCISSPTLPRRPSVQRWFEFAL